MSPANGAAAANDEKRPPKKAKRVSVKDPSVPAVDEDKYIGKWLCEKGPYQEYIAALSGSNPSLKKPDPANKDKPLKPGNAKVILLSADSNEEAPKFEKREFKSITYLREHFSKTNHTHNQRRIYIMEGLAQDYVAAIGGHFFMDPSFFQRQERTCVWSNEFTPTSDALPQPSSLNPEKSFHLQYCELRQFSKALPNAPFFCGRTGRHVGMTAARTKEGKEGTSTGILRRKASWWCRTTTTGGWDVVILCDPKLVDLTPRPNIRDLDQLTNSPFQDGYVDFVPPPRPEEIKDYKGNPHISIIEDLSHYFENHSRHLPASEWNQPLASSFFLKKIIAAHYLQLIDYIKAMLPSLELRLTTAWKEEQDQWKSLQTISRRCGNYSDDIEDTLLSLGYPLESLLSESGSGAGAGMGTAPQPQPTHDWRDCKKDFQYIYFRLRILKQRADTLMQAMTGLASIAGNRQNLEEAKRVKRLNLLALLFIPLAYTSSLFSMQDAFAPGNNQFWVYWVCAISSVAFTFVVTWLLDSALDDAAQWTWRPLEWFKFWDKEKRPQLRKRVETIYGGS